MSSARTKVRGRRARRGVLTFEWILMITLLVIGVIGGLAGIRNAVLGQMFDMQSGIEAMNFSGTGTQTPPKDSTATVDDSSAWWGFARH